MSSNHHGDDDLHHVSDVLYCGERGWKSREGDWVKEQLHLKADADIGEVEGVGVCVEWGAHVTVRVEENQQEGKFVTIKLNTRPSKEVCRGES